MQRPGLPTAVAIKTKWPSTYPEGLPLMGMLQRDKRLQMVREPFERGDLATA